MKESGPGFNWQSSSDEQLLDMRLCDLPLSLEGTPLESRVHRLYGQLEARGIQFRPHVWVGEEWFTPDGVSGFAIPFYLTHPRLMKLERKQMLEVEGGTDKECMRILRHETGHAIDNAYRIHKKHLYETLFGSFTRPYPDSYRPRPDSRNFVLHLGAWYAQAHPAEDFAETFAVWLAPGSQWRRRYKGWAAIRKLEYVDELMKTIAVTPPKNKARAEVEPASGLRFTLREHYRRKREHYAFKWPADFDRDLRRIFSEPDRVGPRPTAVSFLGRFRRELRHEVAEGTGVHHYTVDQVLKLVIDRSKELKLRVGVDESNAKERMLVLLTAHTMNVVHSGYHRIAL
jgi:Putative zinc-binding metallo-peptidase